MSLADENVSKLFQAVRPALPEKVAKKLLEFAKAKDEEGFRSDGLCVDVGCGTGLSTFRLAQVLPRSLQIQGIDLSPFQIAEANRQLPLAEYDNVSFMVSDANKALPYKDNEVDIVTCVQSVHWLDTDHFLTECDRILRPGGVLAITGYSLCRPDLPGASPELNHRMEVLLDELQTTLESQGFWPTRRDLLEQLKDVKLSYPDQIEMRNDPSLKVYRQTTLGEFFGYVETWSALRSLMCQSPNSNLFSEFKQRFLDIMPDTYKSEWASINVIYPWFLLMGRKPE